MQLQILVTVTVDEDAYVALDPKNNDVSQIPTVIADAANQDIMNLSGDCYEFTDATLYTEDADKMNESWHIDDVKNERPDLNDEQCRAVLKAVHDNHDANIGINWEVIRDTAEDLYPEPEYILDAGEIREV